MVSTTAYQRLWGLLVLMYGILVVVMALVPYLAGWRGNPLVGLLLVNLYHGVATAVGVVFAMFSVRAIRDRMAAVASLEA